jgi:hypothetical protein
VEKLRSRLAFQIKRMAQLGYYVSLSMVPEIFPRLLENSRMPLASLGALDRQVVHSLEEHGMSCRR